MASSRRNTTGDTDSKEVTESDETIVPDLPHTAVVKALSKKWGRSAII
jgi:hypothetical protein